MSACNQEVHILIGNVHYRDIMTGKVVKGEHGPVALESKFGFVLSGSTGDEGGDGAGSRSTLVANSLRVSTISSEDLDRSVRTFW